MKFQNMFWEFFWRAGGIATEFRVSKLVAAHFPGVI